MYRQTCKLHHLFYTIDKTIKSKQVNFYSLLALILALYTTSIGVSAQTTYYVDQQNGDDNNNGTSSSTPFKTFGKAANSVTQNAGSQGDTIKIMGTYHNASFDEGFKYTGVDSLAHLWHAEKSITISNMHGNANHFITITNYDSNTLLRGDGANIVRVLNSSYLNIEGLNIEGMVDSIPLSTAHSLQFVYIRYNNAEPLKGTETAPYSSDIHYRTDDEIVDGDGIVEETDTFTNLSGYTVKRPSYIDTRGLYISNCNDINISNNKIHHMPGGGLRVSESKDIKIEGNEIYRTSAKSYSGTHALVVTKTKKSSKNYSIQILNNNIHHNYNEQYSWAPTKIIIKPRIDEGKGISLQRNNTGPWKSASNTSRILVENNLSYWNGYSGFHSNDGYKIDFINNTAFCNHYTNTVTYDGGEQKGNNFGFSCQNGDDIRFYNNISVVSVPDTVPTWKGYAISSAGTTNLKVKNNVSYDLQGALVIDPDIDAVEINRKEANPHFVDAPMDFQDQSYPFDFHLLGSSPAIDFADTSKAPSIDYESNPRPLLEGEDNGAYEYGIYWNGDADNDWHNPTNWSNLQVPAPADSVTIPSPDHYLHHPEVNSDVQIKQLYLNGAGQLIIQPNILFEIQP